MFPPGAFAVGVSVASIDPGVPDEELPADPEPWPSRLGEQLRVAEMTDVQMAFRLRRLQAVKAEIAAFEAELVVGLAERRPAWADRQAGQPGAASGEWAAAPPTAPISAACAEGTTGSRPTPAAGPTP
jgi:hypothetical protein